MNKTFEFWVSEHFASENVVSKHKKRTFCCGNILVDGKLHKRIEEIAIKMTDACYAGDGSGEVDGEGEGLALVGLFQCLAYDF